MRWKKSKATNVYLYCWGWWNPKRRIGNLAWTKLMGRCGKYFQKRLGIVELARQIWSTCRASGVLKGRRDSEDIFRRGLGTWKSRRRSKKWKIQCESTLDAQEASRISPSRFRFRSYADLSSHPTAKRDKYDPPEEAQVNLEERISKSAWIGIEKTEAYALEIRARFRMSIGSISCASEF